jgi:hypothetical protein
LDKIVGIGATDGSTKSSSSLALVFFASVFVHCVQCGELAVLTSVLSVCTKCCARNQTEVKKNTELLGLLDEGLKKGKNLSYETRIVGKGIIIDATKERADTFGTVVPPLLVLCVVWLSKRVDQITKESFVALPETIRHVMFSLEARRPTPRIRILRALVGNSITAINLSRAPPNASALLTDIIYTPRLQVLILRATNLVNDEVLLQISQMRMLKVLDISQCEKVTDVALSRLFPRLNNIVRDSWEDLAEEETEKLDFCAQESDNGKNTKQLFKGLVDLQLLGIYGCKQVTHTSLTNISQTYKGKGIKVYTSLPPLSSLQLHFDLGSSLTDTSDNLATITTSSLEIPIFLMEDIYQDPQFKYLESALYSLQGWWVDEMEELIRKEKAREERKWWIDLRNVSTNKKKIKPHLRFDQDLFG